MSRYTITHYGKWNGKRIDDWKECEIETDDISRERKKLEAEMGKSVAFMYEETPQTEIKNRRKWYAKQQSKQNP